MITSMPKRIFTKVAVSGAPFRADERRTPEEPMIRKDR